MDGSIGKGGRGVYGSGIENHQGRKPLVGSNPTPSAILAAKTKQAPAQSNRNGGGVVVIEPLHSLAQADLLPFTRDLLANPVLVEKARRKGARLVLARLAHNHRGALFADPLVSGESHVRLAEILVETGRNDIPVLDRHH